MSIERYSSPNNRASSPHSNQSSRRHPLPQPALLVDRVNGLHLLNTIIRRDPMMRFVPSDLVTERFQLIPERQSSEQTSSNKFCFEMRGVNLRLPVSTPGLSGSGLRGEIIPFLVSGLTSPLVVDTDIVIQMRHHEAETPQELTITSVIIDFPVGAVVVVNTRLTCRNRSQRSPTRSRSKAIAKL